MNIHWKIFNIINLICLALVISFFSWPVLSGRFSLNDPGDNYYYIFIFAILLTVLLNGLNNISLTRINAAGRKLSLAKKIFFWILVILFAVVIAIFTYLLIIQLQMRFGYSRDYLPYFDLKFFLQILSISITSIYIIITQVILFFKIKRSYRKGLENFIDEIGSP